MHDPLSYFLSLQMRVAFAWGECDCILQPADWVRVVTGTDPAADLRGRYHNAATCQRLTGFLTDPMPVIAPRLAFLPRGEGDPARGDVGLVLRLMAGACTPHGAIYLGEGKWAVKDMDGSTFIEPHKVAAFWRVGLPT